MWACDWFRNKEIVHRHQGKSVEKISNILRLLCCGLNLFKKHLQQKLENLVSIRQPPTNDPSSLG